MSELIFSKEDLINLTPEHETFVGIDSDGCVFDTMEIKQKQCFHPSIIWHWGLEGIETYVREAAEFCNLYSKTRGRNRFPCLVDSIDLLRDRPEVIESGVKLPEFKSLRKWIASGAALGNPSLEAECEKTGDEELIFVLEWSKKVNEIVAETVKNVPPFKHVIECLEKFRTSSDAIVVSQTPTDALIREWDENNITGYVKIIAGQELGTKTEHLSMATEGRYAPQNVLMIGDAPGDRQAAEANKAMFYPINPGKEEASWERLCNEAYDKFLADEYAGEYQQMLIDEFEALLPETPPWK